MSEVYVGATGSLIFVPAEATLKKYGLSREEWLARWHSQGELCPVCGTVPPSGRTVIDHQHIRGWKQMPPDERKKYVRGIVCVTCNHFILTRYGTVRKFLGAAAYLSRYYGNWSEFDRVVREVR